MGMIGHNEIIVFQGDSITDTNRKRTLEGPNYAHGLGQGYVLFIGATLLSALPGLKVFNRGISGDTVRNLARRWQADALDLKPTVLSVLVGINDNWHGPDTDPQRHVPVDEYQATYRKLLAQSRDANPDLKLVLCEPFALQTGDVTEEWLPELAHRRAAVHQLAQEFDAVFVEFQAVFDAALADAPAKHWAGDGYHPTAAGHHRMAQAWLRAVGFEAPAARV